MNTLDTTLTRRRVLTMGLAAAVMPVASARAANAVRVIVNTNAGSGLDGVVRAIEPALAKALGATLVIDNQAGASGLIGLQALARARPDGSTIGFASSNLAIFPSVLKSVPFDVTADFTPLAIIGELPLVVVANPSRIPATSAQEFAALLKSKPEALNYGSSGTGTILHLTTEQLLRDIEVKVNHIPYRGAAPMLIDTVGGQVDFATVSLSAALPHIRSNALHAIGLCMASRTALAPEIPTFTEQGFANVVVESWHSMLGPKGMSSADIKKYYSAIVASLQDAAVREALDKQGTVIRTRTPDEALATIRGDVARYASIVKQIGLEL